MRQTEVKAFCAASSSAWLMDENKEEVDCAILLLHASFSPQTEIA